MTTKQKDKILEKFRLHYQDLVSFATLEKYLECLKNMLNGKIIVKSKSRELQYKAVLRKCEQIGIKLDVVIPHYQKKGDTIKKNVIDKIQNDIQIEKILESCPQTTKGMELVKAIQISLVSGLRLSEVLSLEEKDITILGWNILILEKKTLIRLSAKAKIRMKIYHTEKLKTGLGKSKKF